MNIFFLSKCPRRAARMYCNAHCIKIICELCQMLSCGFYFNDSVVPPGMKLYKKTHANHPMTKWVRSSKANWCWAVQHGLELCEEYYYRYGYKKNRQHLCRKMLLDFAFNFPNFRLEESDNMVYSTTKLVVRIDDQVLECTPVPLCVKDINFSKKLILSYQNYYKTKTFARYTNQEIPYFMTNVVYQSLSS